MTGYPGPGPTAATGTPDRGPRRFFAVLTPIVVVLVVVAGIVGYGYGRPAGQANVRENIAKNSRDGVRTPVPRPTSIAPEPFISSMPRPQLTALETTGPQATLFGPPFQTDQRTQTVHANLPFSFRVPAGKWQVDAPFPQQDIAYADVYLRPTGTESAATSPLRAAFAWRACGKCNKAAVEAFDQRFRKHHDAPEFQLQRWDSRTHYTDITGGAQYYVVVRHLFDGSDGRTYLVEYLTQAPSGDKEQAQQLANEILTQLTS